MYLCQCNELPEMIYVVLFFWKNGNIYRPRTSHTAVNQNMKGEPDKAGTRQGTKVTEYSDRGRGVVLSEQSVSHVSHVPHVPHVSEVIVSTKAWDITKS